LLGGALAAVAGAARFDPVALVFRPPGPEARA